MPKTRVRVADFVRTGHGTGTGTPHVEVPPHDELPAPFPVSPRGEATGKPAADRGDGGEFTRGPGTRALAVVANKIKARKVRLVDSLGLSDMVAESSFGPYRAAAEEFVEHHLAELAKQAGGEVGPAPSTMVSSAALQLGASRWCFDRGAEQCDAALMKLGSALADASRQNLLAAFSLAVREAQARPRVAVDPLAAFRRPTDGLFLDAYGPEGPPPEESELGDDAADSEQPSTTEPAAP